MEGKMDYKNCMCVKILVFFLLLIGYNFPFLVKADTCSDDELVKMKVLANNISVHYEYLDADDETLDWGNTIPYGYNYAITVSGLSEGMYFESRGDVNHQFSYSSTKDGTITYYIQDEGSGLTLKFYSESCYTKYAIRNIEIDLPIFNTYYNTSECEELRGRKIKVDVCQKMISKNLIKNRADFYQSIDKYSQKENQKMSITDKIRFWLHQPYVIIGLIFGGVILVLLIVIFIVKRIKRSRLD